MFRALICKCKSTVFVYVNGTQYMCIDFDGHYSDGSSFVYVSVILKKKKTGKESQFIVSHASERDIWSILLEHGDVEHLMDT